MGERGGEADQSGLLVDRRRLDGRDLVAAERLAHDVEAARERRIAKGLILIARVRGANGGDQRLLRIGQFGLRLGERGGDRADGLARPRHGSPPRSEKIEATAPDFDRLARTPWPVASLASSGINVLSSALARSWSRKAERVAQKRPANSAHELDPPMSTMRTASTRGRGGSTP